MFDMSKTNGMLRCRNIGMSTRSSKKKLFKMRRPRTEKFKKSFTYLGPKKWNALPNNIQLVQTKAEFKSMLNAHIEIKSRKETESKAN